MPLLSEVAIPGGHPGAKQGGCLSTRIYNVGELRQVALARQEDKVQFGRFFGASVQMLGGDAWRQGLGKERIADHDRCVQAPSSAAQQSLPRATARRWTPSKIQCHVRIWPSIHVRARLWRQDRRPPAEQR